MKTALAIALVAIALLTGAVALVAIAEPTTSLPTIAPSQGTMFFGCEGCPPPECPPEDNSC